MMRNRNSYPKGIDLDWVAVVSSSSSSTVVEVEEVEARMRVNGSFVEEEKVKEEELCWTEMEIGAEKRVVAAISEREKLYLDVRMTTSHLLIQHL